MKKINFIPFIILFLLVVVGTIYFLSTYTKKEQKTNKIEKPNLSSITVWINEKETPMFESAIEEFEGNYGVKVNLIEKENNHLKAFHQLNKNEEKPDIFLLSQDDIGVSASESLIQPISLSKETKETFFPSALQSFSYEGTLYGVPKNIHTPVLVYNKKIWETPPKQMSDLLQKQQNKPGFLFDTTNSVFVSSINHTFGANFFETIQKKNKEFPVYNVEKNGFLSPSMIQSFSFINNMKKQFPENESTSQETDSFTKQEVGSILLSLENTSELAETDFDKEIIPLPGMKPNEPSHPVLEGEGFVIPTSSKQKKLALQFLEIVLSKENALLRLETKNEIPPLQTITKEDIEKTNIEDEFFKQTTIAIIESAKSSTAYPSVAHMKDYNSKMQAALQNVLEHRLEPKQSLEYANEEFSWLVHSNY